MRGDPQVIDFLNKALLNELTAINQYWLHYRMLANWGIATLAEFERHESIDEMKHADRLADRVLFLDGLPNFQRLDSLKIGENVEEILKSDLALEMEAIPLLREAILANEEEHVDTLETQFEMIERMGLENYIQLQSKATEAS